MDLPDDRADVVFARRQAGKVHGFDWMRKPALAGDIIGGEPEPWHASGCRVIRLDDVVPGAVTFFEQRRSIGKVLGTPV